MFGPNVEKGRPEMKVVIGWPWQKVEKDWIKQRVEKVDLGWGLRQVGRIEIQNGPTWKKGWDGRLRPKVWMGWV